MSIPIHHPIRQTMRRHSGTRNSCLAHPSSPTPEKTVITKFYDPVYLHDEYEYVDTLRLAARSRVKQKHTRFSNLFKESAFFDASVSMRQLFSNRMEGRFMSYCWSLSLGRACNTSVKREIIAIPSSQPYSGQPWILSATVSFMQVELHGTLSSDLYFVKVLFAEIDDVGAAMVDFERIGLEDPPDPDGIRLAFMNVVRSEYFFGGYKPAFISFFELGHAWTRIGVTLFVNMSGLRVRLRRLNPNTLYVALSTFCHRDCHPSVR
ncbi:uncharacterized protein ARMOST_12069 [Armillaria ostoyae]|uniref:Uncharacterized protein n=1 Tax=Armillaria ostoyae TaxID=47428 RepID=A0A284RIW4_ARMOS|nr:uncharacterized protein ARMOST_12069 [Armillaria ostoyae]